VIANNFPSAHHPSPTLSFPHPLRLTLRDSEKNWETGGLMKKEETVLKTVEKETSTLCFFSL